MSHSHVQWHFLRLESASPFFGVGFLPSGAGRVLILVYREGDWTLLSDTGSTFYLNFCSPTVIACSSPGQALCEYEGSSVEKSLPEGDFLSASYDDYVQGSETGVQIQYASLLTCNERRNLVTFVKVVCDRMATFGEFKDVSFSNATCHLTAR